MITEFKPGFEVKLSDGGNVYRVGHVLENHVLLHCVWFSHKEDLGDGIFCTEEGQDIWVALYHARHYELIPLESA